MIYTLQALTIPTNQKTLYLLKSDLTQCSQSSCWNLLSFLRKPDAYDVYLFALMPSSHLAYISAFLVTDKRSIISDRGKQPIPCSQQRAGTLALKETHWQRGENAHIFYISSFDAKLIGIFYKRTMQLLPHDKFYSTPQLINVTTLSNI